MEVATPPTSQHAQDKPPAGASAGRQPASVPYAVFQAIKAENQQLKAFLKWEDELFTNPHLSGNHKLELRATRRAVQRAQVRDEAGRVRINLTTLAGQIGVSPDTMSRGLKVLKQCGVIADHATRTEIQENGERWTRHYIRLDEERISRPQDIQPPQPRNHGGPRYRCQQCGSDRVRLRRRLSLVCTRCQHESLLEESERDLPPAECQEEGQAEQQEQQERQYETPAKNFTQPGRSVQPILKPVSAPNGLQVAEHSTAGPASGETGNRNNEQAELPAQPAPPGEPAPHQADQPGDQQTAQHDELHAAASLLLAIAGPAGEHIVMGRRGPAKYYTVRRTLSLQDVLDHLAGGPARGAWCAYEEGRTRALCWDRDDEAGYQLLAEAARALAMAGYFPLLERSPAGRGGHLWIVYDALVEAQAARRAVFQVAPQLATLPEYWPGPRSAKRWNKVRLPGGRYVRESVDGWCELLAVATGEYAAEGREAGRLLLSHQTPVALVPATVLALSQPVGDGQVEAQREESGQEPEQAGEAAPETEAEDAGQDEQKALPAGQVDSQWYAKYDTPEGARLWFAWTPQYLAAWWNNRHGLDELLPDQRPGYGLATWRRERTASVAKRGERWTDFGAGARRADGGPDGGDALELQVRVSGTTKAEVLREIARDLLREARQALEGAARAGEALPAWLEKIITEAGRAHYARLLEEARRSRADLEAPGGPEEERRAGPGEAAPAGQTGDLAAPAPRASAAEPAGGRKLVQGGQQGALTGFALPNPAPAVPSSSQLADLQWLETIKQYGEQRGWTALVVDGEELIPAGRPAWLRFIWLSGEEERQRRAFDFISKEVNNEDR